MSHLYQAMPRLYTVEQIAELLATEPSKVWNLVRKNQLPEPTIKTPQIVRWNADAVDSYVRGHRV